jgi:signal transduction histidine kinase
MAALDAATDGVLLINRAGLIVYANRAAETFFANIGLTGVFFADVTSVERSKLNAIWRGLYRTRFWHGRLNFSGQGVELAVTVQRVSEEGSGDNFCVVLHGATRPAGMSLEPVGDSRSVRSAMNELQASLRAVASEIAHDFNNQIAVILNYTFVLLRQMPQESPLKAHVSEMQAAAWRASQIAQAIHRALVTHTTHTSQTMLPSGK